MLSCDRARASLKAGLVHLAGSFAVSALAAVFVFLIWYPYPYSLLSGGRNLFLLLVGVDVVCGPLLTSIVFNPHKSRRELVADLLLIIVLQLMALLYGVNAVYEARPIFLVHEVDRFRVIADPDFGGADVQSAIRELGEELRPNWLRGPITVGIRDPKNFEERKKVMLESLSGGRDYSQRPEFYIPYDDAYREKALARSKPLSSLIVRYPRIANEASGLLSRYGVAQSEAYFLPVVHKLEWVAVVDKTAKILGFLPVDGFVVE